jgi:hypothetical protein
MKIKNKFLGTFLIFQCFFVISINMTAQNKDDFWSRVRFGGSGGLEFGNDYFSATVAPNMLYQFSSLVSAGVGVHYSHIGFKNSARTNLYGASLIGLFTPLEYIQLSAELEQTYVYTKFLNTNLTDDYWVTGLFLGAGYFNGRMTVGMRYNVLYNSNNTIYRTPFLPFVRVFF